MRAYCNWKANVVKSGFNLRRRAYVLKRFPKHLALPIESGIHLEVKDKSLLIADPNMWGLISTTESNSHFGLVSAHHGPMTHTHH